MHPDWVPQVYGPLFVPVDGEPNQCRPPASLFGPGCPHPKPPIHIQTTASLRRPIGTNKWYTQLVLSPGGTDPIYPLPYALAFLDGHSVLSKRGQASGLVGLGISHCNPSDRVLGPPAGGDIHGPARFYYNPLWISICLSAKEIVSSNVVASLLDWSELAAQFSISCSTSSPATTPGMSIPICRGSAFVTCLYTHLTPTISSVSAVVSMDCLNCGQEGKLFGFRKHRIQFNDGATWLVYSQPNLATTDSHLELHESGPGLIGHSRGPWSGVIQIIKMSEYYAKDLGENFHRCNEEAVYDQGVGVWVRNATIRSGPIDSGLYSFDWISDGPRMQFEPPLMFALPHHIEAMTSPGIVVKPDISLNSRVTGKMRLCRGSIWSFKEDVKLVGMYGIEPMNPGHVQHDCSQSRLELIRDVFLKELDTDFDKESDLDSYYFSGKKLAKQALQCLTASSILQDADLTEICVAKARKSLQKFCHNRQKAAPLVYETSWKGIISSSILRTGNENDDFGNGVYNDHHFHYSYFIHAASVMVHLDRSFLDEISDYIHDLIRDINNANEADQYFPLFRNFDWFLGHSLATGLQSSLDGKNQESCSEDANFLYSLKVWAEATQNMALGSLANLQLSLLKRSADHYYYMSESNTTVPSEFKRNRVPGILFENKADYTTFFSNEKDAIHMIQVIPITPSTPFLRKLEFVREEWIDSGLPRDDTGQICHLATNLTNGYRTLLLTQYGTVDPQYVWQFLTNRFHKQQREIPLDDGISLSWILGFLWSQF